MSKRRKLWTTSRKLRRDGRYRQFTWWAGRGKLDMLLVDTQVGISMPSEYPVDDGTGKLYIPGFKDGEPHWWPVEEIEGRYFESPKPWERLPDRPVEERCRR